MPRYECACGHINSKFAFDKGRLCGVCHTKAEDVSLEVTKEKIFPEGENEEYIMKLHYDSRKSPYACCPHTSSINLMRKFKYSSDYIYMCKCGTAIFFENDDERVIGVNYANSINMITPTLEIIHERINRLYGLISEIKHNLDAEENEKRDKECSEKISDAYKNAKYDYDDMMRNHKSYLEKIDAERLRERSKIFLNQDEKKMHIEEKTKRINEAISKADEEWKKAWNNMTEIERKRFISE